MAPHANSGSFLASFKPSARTCNVTRHVHFGLRGGDDGDSSQLDTQGAAAASAVAAADAAAADASAASGEAAAAAAHDDNDAVDTRPVAPPVRVGCDVYRQVLGAFVGRLGLNFGCRLAVGWPSAGWPPCSSPLLSAVSVCAAFSLLPPPSQAPPRPMRLGPSQAGRSSGCWRGRSSCRTRSCRRGCWPAPATRPTAAPCCGT